MKRIDHLPTLYRSASIWLLITLSACARPTHLHTILPSFYYWKGNYKLTGVDKAILDKWQVHRLYVRLFDVSLGPGGPVPTGEVVLPDSINGPELNIVPVVYFKNDVFGKLTGQEVDDLALHIDQKLRGIRKKRPFEEVQFDCDWTKSTRSNYFRFLDAYKKANPQVRVAATIRLHQVKYRESTGVPPVDIGMLMLYNLDSPVQFQKASSILDIPEARKYLAGQRPYPLPLDLACPIFHWIVRYRNWEFQGFVQGLDPESLKGSGFLSPQGNNFYQVTADTTVGNNYLRIGDWLKVEQATQNDIQQVIALAMPLVSNDTLHLTPFHLDPALIKQYDDNLFKTIFEAH